jgi:hypothetical protein
MFFRDAFEGQTHPQEIAGWTLYQLKMFTADKSQITGTMRMSGEEYRAMRADKKKAKKGAD